MFKIFIFSTFLFAITDIAYSKYHSVSHGWISQHKVATTWDKAYRQCQREGAVLASPTTIELRDKMQSLIGGNTTYFTGIRATYDNDVFVSVEGIPLDDMPVLDLFEQLDSEYGLCLTMNSYNISVKPCSSRLPYMCFNKQIQNSSLSDCGTYDKGYKYVNSTGSCYKLHSNYSTWVDAFVTCIAEDSYLAIINDANEASVLSNDILLSKEKYIWIGLVDWKATDEWKSIHGQPLNEIFHKWDASNVKFNTTTRCGTVNPYSGNIHDLGDCISGIVVPFLCEKSPPGKNEIETYDITLTNIRT